MQLSEVTQRRHVPFTWFPPTVTSCKKHSVMSHPGDCIDTTKLQKLSIPRVPPVGLLQPHLPLSCPSLSLDPGNTDLFSAFTILSFQECYTDAIIHYEALGMGIFYSAYSVEIHTSCYVYRSIVPFYC